MRIRKILGSGFILAVVACSGGNSQPDHPAPAPAVAPSAQGGASSGNTLAYFSGTVDARRGTMDVVVRSPSGKVVSQSTLPYGTTTNHVYFHTCPPVTYNSGTHILTGSVAAANLFTIDAVTSMNAVVDSISATGVTLASGSGSGGTSGIIASYGSVGANTAPNCGAAQPWLFHDTSDTPFTFMGHADGVQGTSACSTAPEGGTISLSCAAGQTIQQVTYASYGTPTGSCPGPFTNGSCNAATSVSFTQGQCLGKTSCSFAASNGNFGDPCGGTVKNMAATVLCQQGGVTHVCSTAPENGTISLSCNPGQTIQAITYASYGTPTGSCPGPFANGSCNAATSVSFTQGQCLGKASCSFAANNTNFGDPCSGTLKNMAVTADCQ